MTHDRTSVWQQLEPWLLLFHVPGLGPVRYRILVDRFGHPEAVLSAGRSSLLPLVPEHLLQSIMRCRHDPAIHAALEHDRQWLSCSAQHTICHFGGRGYPSQLAAIEAPPPLLYVAGDFACLSAEQIAMVGSRKPTVGALKSACHTAAQLVGAGFVITSGMAIGIDAQVHKGALDAGGKTVAVLAGGVDTVYPARHRQLAERIRQQGALVSEFPLGTNPKPGHFPRRNRIISGLGLGVVVVEAAVDSGSLVTARCALEQGREVFAMPGSVHNPQVRGCHKLIREGACLTECAQHVIEELAGVLSGSRFRVDEAAEPSVTSARPLPVCANQRQLLTCMGYDLCHPDELIVRSGLDSRTVSELLQHLELDGWIKATTGGVMRTT